MTPAVEIDLSGIVTVDSLELRLSDATTESNFSYETDLVFDFRETAFILLPALQIIASIFAQRKKDSLKSKIRMPLKTSGVARFWEKIRFQDAIEGVMRRPFNEFVVSNVSQPGFAQTSIPNGAHGGLNQRSSSFGFSYFPRFSKHDPELPPESKGAEQLSLDLRVIASLTEAEKTTLVKRAYHEWFNSGHAEVVSKVLDPVDKGFTDEDNRRYIGSRAVFELIQNSFRHADASIIHRASTLYPGTNDNTFELVVWDDGKGILDTFRDALALKKAVRREYSPFFDRLYVLKEDSTEGSEATMLTLVSSKETPDLTWSDAKLLLAAFFPGTTSNVNASDHMTSPADKPTDEIGFPGMGLFALVNTVVNQFNGTVSIRTGSLFLNINKSMNNLRKNNRKKPFEEVGESDYWVTVKSRKSLGQNFAGNMITVRCPCKK
jgi:hypothetical protein